MDQNDNMVIKSRFDSNTYYHNQIISDWSAMTPAENHPPTPSATRFMYLYSS